MTHRYLSTSRSSNRGFYPVYFHSLLLLVFLVFISVVGVTFAVAGVEQAPEKQQAGNSKDDPANSNQIKWKTSNEFIQSIKPLRKDEEQKYLQERYDRATVLMQNKDLFRDREVRAFLLTPREKFCRSWNLGRAYDHAYLDIRHGVTISGPHLVGRMTSALEVNAGDKVLEVGTGSGYQAAMLSYLTDKVYTVEIIDPLAKETDNIYEQLASSGYPEYANIKRKSDDGYYGWEEMAPFDKIIVTCGIDHIPPPLLKQLKVGGVMVVPVGPPGAQVILKVTKNQDEQGNFVIAREDIYHGKKKENFVPFTNKTGGTHFK